MNRGRLQDWPAGVKLLSLLLAALLWLSVVLERPAEMKLQVSLRPEGLPAGMRLASPPGELEVTVSGPRIVLCRLFFRDLSCQVDLAAAAGDGTCSIVPREASLGLDPELKVVRMNPAAVSFVLAKEVR